MGVWLETDPFTKYYRKFFLRLYNQVFYITRLCNIGEKPGERYVELIEKEVLMAIQWKQRFHYCKALLQMRPK